MRRKKWYVLLLVTSLIGLGMFLRGKLSPYQPESEITKEVTPFRGTIREIVSATGTVLPKNRLEVKPPVNGRVEELRFNEGAIVKSGDILAWISSTERAALMDSARGKNETDLKYWQDVYKPIPLIAPIDGEVIVATTQPGQAVTTADAVLVLSDKLIIRAQVDETDIGKIKQGLEAVVVLDAYPDDKIKAKVDHIYYESKTVNNVTIYQVDLLPESIPDFCRSGMNASVDFIVKAKEDVLLLSNAAIIKEQDEAYCLVKRSGVSEPLMQVLVLGMSDEKSTEIISGLASDDQVIIKSRKYALPTSQLSSNPLVPQRPGARRSR